MQEKQNQQVSYFTHSLFAPRIIGKSYFSVIVAGICISITSLIVNLTFDYVTETLLGEKNYDLSSIWSIDWWQFYIPVYVSGILFELFHYLFCAVIVFTLWKTEELKYILPSDIASAARMYLRNVILLSLNICVLFIIFDALYSKYIDLSFLGSIEFNDNSFTPWSSVITTHFINPIFTLLFIISLSAMLIKKINPFQAIYEIWIFLNLAPVGLILFTYVFIIISAYVPRALVDLIRTPYYLSQMKSGENTHMVEAISVSLAFNSLSGLIFMILFAIPCATIVHYFSDKLKSSIE